MRVDFHPEHLKLSWKEFQELFKHLPYNLIKREWEKANKPIKAVKKK